MKKKCKLFPFSLLVTTVLIVFSHGLLAAVTDGLVLYMPFEEGSGNKTKDKSRTRTEGEIKNGTWVDGKYGKALQFHSSTGYVLVPDQKSFHIEKEITQSAWVWLD